jgi:putative flippase GtrA
MNSESVKTIDDGYSVWECSEAEETSGASPLTNQLPIKSLARRLSTGRILKFAVVGGSGAVLNTAVLYVLYRRLQVPLVAASALAAELAVVNNYLLNDRWTFAARSPSIRRFAKFNVSSLGGLAVNVLSVWFLTRHGLPVLVANLAGIAAGMAVNLTLSVTWVWRRKA